MSCKRIVPVVALALCCAATANAQSVRIEFKNGLVSISAQNAPVRQILAEWARLGGTTFVNADRIPGGPVTLQLEDVPERKAVDVLLRGVAGYMAAARDVVGLGASTFDRVLIVPTSTAPRPTTNAFVPPPATPLPQIDFDRDDPEEDLPNDIPPQEVDTDRPGIQRTRMPFVPPNANGRPLPPQPFQPEPDEDQEPPRQPVVTPNNPFGVLPGGARPGTITPVPPQRGTRQPQPVPEP